MRIERVRDISAAEPKARLYQRRLPTKLIDDREHAKGPAIEQLIVNEVHAPALMRTLCLRRYTAMQAHVLASSNAHPKLQAFQPIEPTNALLVHWPTLTSQHHVDA
jgi:hypothetical protein